MNKMHLSRLIGQHEFWLGLLVVALAVGLSISTDEFLSLGNLTDVATSYAILGILACGLFVVLISGGIDISFPAMTAIAQYAMASWVIGHGGNFALALIIATLGVYQHASNQYVYLMSLFALGFLVFGPQLLIGVAAVGFVPKKAIGAADGIKGTFAYLIGDSFAKLGLGMIADGTPVFGLTGWAGTFAALDIAAIGCICLMAIVAVMEERKIRREKKIQQLTVA